MHVVIREMEAADIEKVRQIYILGWQNAFRGIVPQLYLDRMNLEHWAPPLKGSYVLTDGKNILGTSSISPAREPAYNGWGEIISIYILPELIGQGYGHLLFEFVREKLLSLDYNQIYLTVFEDNISAREFYEKHGFTWNHERISTEIAGKKLIELRYIFKKDSLL